MTKKELYGEITKKQEMLVNLHYAIEHLTNAHSTATHDSNSIQEKIWKIKNSLLEIQEELAQSRNKDWKEL